MIKIIVILSSVLLIIFLLKSLPPQNQELIDNSMSQAEKLAKEKAEKDEKIKKILAVLKTIPVSKYQENKYYYYQLVLCDPDNEKFKKKLKFYSDKIKEPQEAKSIEQKKIRKKQEARIARLGEPPTQSPWDGSYLPVERYLRSVANDPDSIKIYGCTEVYYTENGWVVFCDYGGCNAFGGMIRKSNWFTIVHDKVIQVHDASAYAP